MNTVTAVACSGNDLPQEDDIVAILFDRHIVVVHAAACFGKFGQFVIVRCKLGAAAAERIVMEKFRHGPCDRKTVKGTCTAADLIENDQTFRRDMVQNICRFHHFHHKGTLPASEVVSCTDTGEDTVDQTDFGGVGGQETSHLSHDDQQGRLADIGGFTGHIRSGNKHHAVQVSIQHAVVGNELAAIALGIQYGMSAAFDDEAVIVVDGGAVVVVQTGTFGQTAEGIDFGESIGGILNAGGELQSETAEFLKELGLQSQSFFFCSEDLAFQFFEFRSDEAFRIDQCLLADIIFRNGVEVGLAHFDIVTENRIEFDFERLDAGAFLFPLLNA